MNEQIPTALRAVWERVGDLVKTDAELRGRVRSLAELLLKVTAGPEPVPPIRPPAPPPDLPRPPLPPITFHLPKPEPPSTPAVVQRLPLDDACLPDIEARCRLKAEACRWVGRRHADRSDWRDDSEPTDRPLIDRAKELPDCFLWMLHRADAREDAAGYDLLAGSFDAAADATNLLQLAAEQPDRGALLGEAIQLAAEAQSMIRAAVGAIDRGYIDNDQIKLYIWLRESAAERGTLIRRYLKREDPADPTDWPGLRERIAELARRFRRGRDRDKRRRELFNQARYHLRRIHADAGGEHLHDWNKLVAAVAELVDGGLPASNVELRDLVLPVADDIPDDLPLPKNVELVLREIDRYLALRPAGAAAVAVAEPPTEDVRKAGKLLRGRSLVMIGGERRPEAAAALEAAFGLDELIWENTREHQTHTVFEASIARKDVAAVVLAIRWSNHGFGEVKEYCDKYDKPLVRLPAGFNPNQVAYHLLRQVGDRLAGPTAVPAD
jgi:hypothetical protein